MKLVILDRQKSNILVKIFLVSLNMLLSQSKISADIKTCQ